MHRHTYTMSVKCLDRHCLYMVCTSTRLYIFKYFISPRPAVAHRDPGRAAAARCFSWLFWLQPCLQTSVLICPAGRARRRARPRVGPHPASSAAGSAHQASTVAVVPRGRKGVEGFGEGERKCGKDGEGGLGVRDGEGGLGVRGGGPRSASSRPPLPPQ